MNPSPAVQANFLDLLHNAGPVAKGVLLVLVLASVFCWAIIITKWSTFRLVNRENKVFFDIFWHSKNIEEILSKADRFNRSSLATLFKKGIEELKRAGHDSSSNMQEKTEQMYRTLIKTSTQELSSLEKHLNWLATTASAAPFVGLFGTVWGIMNSFQNIGATGNANLAVVAPGISEALVATAAGIAAAVPAVIAYNVFNNEIKKVATDMENFSHDFVTLFQKSGKKG